MYDEPDEPAPLQRGDKLFLNDEWRQQLDILEGYGYNGFKRSNFFSYSLAYKQAADILVQNNRSLPDIFLDALVLPIVFLYRHYVELTLKDLLAEWNETYGKPSTPKHEENLKKILKEHRIDSLWQELKPLLQKLYEHENRSEYIEVVGACLLEFSDVDAGSFSFRYPVDKRNNPSLQNNPHRFLHNPGEARLPLLHRQIVLHQ